MGNLGPDHKSRAIGVGRLADKLSGLAALATRFRAWRESATQAEPEVPPRQRDWTRHPSVRWIWAGLNRLRLREYRRLRGWGYLPIGVVSLIGGILTYNTYEEVRVLSRKQVEYSFQRAAQDRVLMVQREVEYSLSLVQDIASLFNASPVVGRRDFRRFVGPALRRQPAIHSLQWVPLVAESQVKDFVAEARRSLPSFRLTELDLEGKLVKAGPRPIHFPILYVQPYKRNKELLGYDLGADRQAWQALTATRNSGQLQVSLPLLVFRDGRERQSYAVYVPVYAKADSPEFQAEEDEDEGIPGELRGFVVGIFCIEDVVERPLANLQPAGILMRFFVRHPDDRITHLYTHFSRLHKDNPPDPNTSTSSIQPILQSIKLGNQSLDVILEAEPGNYLIDYRSGVLVLVAGAAFTLLLAIYIWTLVNRAAKVDRLVNRRTYQLRSAITALNKEIMERKRAENNLQGLNENLESIVRVRTQEAERRANELEQFAYVTSHDLKAPLRAISNLATWIEEDLRGKLDEATREQLTLLRDRVQRMHTLIEGLLEYSRVGHTRVTEVAIDSGELLRETIDSLAPPDGFTIDIPADMPRLRGDRLQMGQVFSNLISNGIKHHGGSRGHIWIRFQDLGNQLEFSVGDDGPGIAPEYHGKVFMMFQTLETKDVANSTGIGLALVKKIVQEQGGTIQLNSELGKGAIFTFTWPKTPVTDPQGKTSPG